METLQKTLAIQTPYWETLRVNPDTALLSHLEAWERERDRDGWLLEVGSDLAIVGLTSIRDINIGMIVKKQKRTTQIAVPTYARMTSETHTNALNAMASLSVEPNIIAASANAVPPGPP